MQGGRFQFYSVREVQRVGLLLLQIDRGELLGPQAAIDIEEEGQAVPEGVPAEKHRENDLNMLDR